MFNLRTQTPRWPQDAQLTANFNNEIIVSGLSLHIRRAKVYAAQEVLALFHRTPV